MKCWRCRAANPRDALTCWACGVRLGRRGAPPAPLACRPEAMRHYRALSATLEPHRLWVDGLVLLSTVLFGLFVGYFLLGVVPLSTAGRSPRAAFGSLLAAANPLALLTPPPRILPVVPAGATHEVGGVVVQVAEPRRGAGAGSRQAAQGTEFLTIIAVVDNQGRLPLSFSLGDWQVVDSHGQTHAAEAIDEAGWLSGGAVEPGAAVQGRVAFLIPRDDAGPLVTFRPKALHAVMRWSTASPAGNG